MRKIYLLIDNVTSIEGHFLDLEQEPGIFSVIQRSIKTGKFQARKEKNHEVLGIGFGWGTLAIENYDKNWMQIHQHYAIY